MKSTIHYRQIIISALFLLSRNAVIAQNLVPNPGFDDTLQLHCGIYSPGDFTQSVNYWESPSQGSPDLFSTEVPSACWNHQPLSSYNGLICLKGTQAPRSGSCFAGISAYTIDGLNQREYLQTQLITATVPGIMYCVEFYVSLADYTEKSIGSLGAYFSVNPLNSNNDEPLPVTPQVISSTPLTNDSSWFLVSGNFVASDSYQYLTIGNFNPDSSSITATHSGSPQPGCYGAYYFVEDVSVYRCNLSGTDEPQLPGVQVWPTVTIDRVQISMPDEALTTGWLTDISGKTLTFTFRGSHALDMQALAPGIYHLMLLQEGIPVFSQRIIRP